MTEAHENQQTDDPASAVFGTIMAVLVLLAVLYAFAAYFDWVPGPLG